MTEHQIMREARYMATELVDKPYIIAARAKGRKDCDVAKLDSLLREYGVEKAKLKEGFYLFFKKEDSSMKGTYIRKAKRELPSVEKEFNDNNQGEGWGVIYW